MRDIAATVARLVTRSVRQHALPSGIAVAAIALASGLVLATLAIQRQAASAFAGGALGFDAILGPRGSELQLVLSTAFQLETSPGTLPWAFHDAVAAEPGVRAAIPVAVGDNYQGFRVVGTSAALFERARLPDGDRLTVERGGRLFGPRGREAVAGSLVAERTGLAVGSTFTPFHGLVYDPGSQHPETLVVVGILEPTGTPVDRVIWIPIEAVHDMTGHTLRGERVVSGDAGVAATRREVSAVLLQLEDDGAGRALSHLVNRQGDAATLAYPVPALVAQLFDSLGWVHRVLTAVAAMTTAVAAGSILSSLSGSLAERRRDIAILRALGAGRGTVTASVMAEATAIAASGAIAGYAVYAVLAAVAATMVRARTGVQLDVFSMPPAVAIVPLVIVALGALAGLLPALAAYRTDVATHLAPPS